MGRCARREGKNVKPALSLRNLGARTGDGEMGRMKKTKQKQSVSKMKGQEKVGRGLSKLGSLEDSGQSWGLRQQGGGGAGAGTNPRIWGQGENAKGGG